MRYLQPSLSASLLLLAGLSIAGPLHAQRSGRPASLVFIADDVPEADQLAAQAAPGSEVVHLARNRDALVQIGSALAERHNVGEVVLVSHGSPGALHFGSNRVGISELARRSTELRGWRSSLSRGADVLVYGCDVGAGTEGAAFVSELSSLTGADVAASTNTTGGTGQGDWILERQVGHVTASAPWSRDVMAHWQHSLTVYTEPPDLSNNIGTAPVIVLTSGSNTVSGTVATPSDGQDNFQVTVPAGFRLTAAALTLNTASGFNGSVTFNLNENLSSSGNFTVGLPLPPGTYYVQVVANFAVGNSWSMAFTLASFTVCGNGVREAGEACDDGNTTSCDGCSATCTVDVNGCSISGVCVADGTVSPTNACMVCARATNRNAYSAIANGTLCNDSNACTRTDTCQAGTCVGASPVTCTAADQCHVAGVCNSATGTCSSPTVPNGTVCNDGNACTQTDSCQAGVCAGGNPVTCTAVDQCHAAGVCNTTTGVCSAPAAPNGTVCSDGNACSRVDICQSGVCIGMNPVLCTAIDQCHGTGTCDPTSGACSNPVAPNGLTCNDGNACTQTDSCQGGICAGGNPVSCTAADQCHVAGVCNPNNGVCSAPIAANGTTCNDGNACSQTDTCQTGVCTGANPVTCTASDQCHLAGVCSPTTGSCSSPVAANGTSCNDGNACSQTDTCQTGVCTGANPVTCTASDQCHVAGTCDPTSGSCSAPASPNGTACNDGNACSQTDTCQTGVCTGANPVTCTAADQCHVAGTCDPTSGTCSMVAAANGTVCNDGDACSQTDTCQAGACTGTNPVTCSAADQCHVAGVCDSTTGSCSTPAAAQGTTCDDGLFCTLIDTCDSSGNCTGTTRDCSDGNVCTLDSCNEGTRSCTSSAIPSCADAGTDGAVDTDAETEAGTDSGLSNDAASDAQTDAARDVSTDAISDVRVSDASGDSSVRDGGEGGVQFGDANTDGSDADGGMGSSMHGCGCRAVTSTSGGKSTLIVLFLALALGARKNRSRRSQRRS